MIKKYSRLWNVNIVNAAEFTFATNISYWSGCWMISMPKNDIAKDNANVDLNLNVVNSICFKLLKVTAIIDRKI